MTAVLKRSEKLRPATRQEKPALRLTEPSAPRTRKLHAVRARCSACREYQFAEPVALEKRREGDTDDATGQRGEAGSTVAHLHEIAADSD